MKKYIIISLITIFSVSLKAQNQELLRAYKDSIKQYSSKIMKMPTDEELSKISAKIQKFCIKFINQEKSIEYNMDDLKLVKVLTSSDKKIRFFTWVLPFSNKENAYKGIVQTYSKSKKDFLYFILNDKGDRLRYSQNKNLSPKKWLGAYYYKIIETKKGKKRFYTLLGWRGVSKTIQSKVVEVATLRSNGNLSFGYNIFDITGYEYFGKGNKSSKRLIFKFSTQGNMYLNYDYQTIIIKKTKTSTSRKKQTYKPGFNAQNGPKKEKVKIKTIKSNMIVMDRLVPTSPQMIDFYEFYYPESNIIDALLWKGNKWVYFPDIDARNKAEENQRKPHKIEYDLIPK